MSEKNVKKDELDELYESLQIEDAENLDLEQLNDYFGFDIFGLEKEMEDYQETLEFKFSKSNPDGVSPKYAYTSLS